MEEGKPESETQPITAALEQLRLRLNELHEESEEICRQHLDFVMDRNKRMTWQEKSILFVKARVRDNALTVTWHEIHWYGSNAARTRRMVKKVIVKPSVKPAYNMVTLLKRARYWEKDMVREIEKKLIPLRWEAAFISKAIGHLNHIAKRNNK